MSELPRNLPAGYGTGRCSCDEKPDDRCCKLGHPGVVPIEMMLPKAIVRPTRYTVTCVPRDAAPDAHVWALYVEEQRDGSWVVSNGHEWLDADHMWHIACSSNAKACSFDEQTALRLAREHTPRVVVGHRTVAQALALAAEWKRNGS
jgi:hypothetical protein